MAEPNPHRPNRLIPVVAAIVLVLALILLLLLARDRGVAPDLADDEPNVEAFEGRVQDALPPVAVRPATALRVRAAAVEWRARGANWLEVPALAFTVDAAALAGDAILLRDGRIDRPVVRLAQGPGGTWNYQAAIDPLLNGQERPGRAGGGTPVSLRNFVVVEGRVVVERPDQRIVASSVNARLTRAELSGPGVVDPTFLLASAEAELDLPGLEGERVSRRAAVESATLRIADGAVAFEVESGAFGQSRFADASGVWDPALGGWGLDAVLTADPVRLADLPWLRTELPDDAVGSFRLRIQPLPGDRNALAFSDLRVTGGGSEVAGAARIIVGGPAAFALESADLRLDPLDLALVEAFTGPLPYSGTVTGRVVGSGSQLTFDVQARLDAPGLAQPFTTGLEGALAFTPEGIDLEQLTTSFERVPLSALAPLAPGLPLSGPISGTVTLRGMPTEVPMTIDVRLEAGGGIITMAGTLDLTGAVPAYDLEGRLAGVELRQVVAPSVPPVQVHAAFSLTGVGTDPATLTAAATANGTFTGWESEPGDTLALDVVVSGGEVTAEQFRVAVGPIDAAAEGTWQFTGAGGGAIRYALTIESLAPLGPYLPEELAGATQFARGSVQAQGSITGTLEQPSLAGTVRAVDFRYGDWATSRLVGEYQIVSTAGLPVIEAEFVAEDLRTPGGDFDRATVDVDFTRPEFEIAVAADRVDDGVLEFVAGGRIDEETGEREVLLRTMELDLEDQRWRLPQPATIAWTRGDAVIIEDLRLEQVDGEGLFRVDGTVAPADQAAFVLEVRELPLGEIQRLTGLDLELEGDLTAAATFAGPAEQPTFDAEIRLTEGAYRDVVVRDLVVDLAYSDAELLITGGGRLGEAAAVEIEGRVPIVMELGLVPSFTLVEDAPLEATLVTTDFPLETLDPGIRMVRDLEGEVDADVRIAGTPAQPVLSGNATLREGTVRVPMLNQRYHDISAVATFDGRQMILERLVATSGGTATATGTLTFDDLTNPALDLTAELNAFEPQGVSNYSNASAWGTVRVTGTVQQPDVRGSVRLDDGTLEILAFEGPTFEGQFDEPPEFELVRPQDAELPDPEAGITVTNLRVEAGSDLWFATDEMRVQLSGDLIVNRQAGEFAIAGQLAGDRGTFQLRAGPVTRRFDIIEANIRFFGTPGPNPGLEVVASRLIRTARSGDVEVRARVSGTLNNPSLSLATGEGATIPESEILSFLLFGRSEATLGTVTGGGLLGWEEALAFAGGFDYLSETLLRAADIGIDQFQIQMRPGGGIQGANLFLIVGHEVVDDVFVTWETPLDPSNDIWALTGEWRIDRQWTLEAGLEPVRYNTGAIIPIPQILGDRDQQQIFIAVRRRWTY